MKGAALVLVAVLAGCGCAGSQIKRPYPPPEATAIVAHVQALRERAQSLRAQTKSDARVGDERANVQVLIMAAWGGKLRFMALNPNDSMAADLAADGQNYCFIDTHANCGECGPSTAANVARLIRITLDPDEVVAVMLGSTPLLGDATTTLEWDAGAGQEKLVLERDGWKQRVALVPAGDGWDVVDSELTGPDGKRAWRIQHKGFRDVKTTDGKSVRLPAKSMFEDPRDSVLIRWQEQEVNLTLEERHFALDVPEGLRACPRRP